MQTLCEIKCLGCNRWFPSAMQFSDAKSFFTSMPSGSLQHCPFEDCGHMTPVTKENMRFEAMSPDGGVSVIEGKDFLG